MANIVSIAIDGTNNLVLTYYDDGTVSRGSSKDLSSKGPPRPFILPGDRNPNDIVGTGVDGDNDFVFAWYKDGTVSAGTSRDLSSRRTPKKYKLPGDRRPKDIAAMGIDGSNNLVCAWYKDGMVSAGSSRDLDSRRQLTRYALAPSKTPANVVGIAVDGFVHGDNWEKHLEDLVGSALDLSWKAFKDAGAVINDFFFSRGSLCFAWYDDLTVSAGKSTQLDEARPPYKYKI